MSRESMTFKNTSEHTLKLRTVGLPDVPPGQTVEVPLALCAPGRADNGSRTPSSIECVAPQLRPVDEELTTEWEKAPDPLPRKSLMVTSVGRAPDEPAGVVAVRKAQEALRAKKAAEAAAKATPVDNVKFPKAD